MLCYPDKKYWKNEEKHIFYWYFTGKCGMITFGMKRSRENMSDGVIFRDY